MPTSSPGSPSIADLTPKFIRYIEAELCFARSSVIKYEDCLRQIIKMIGDRPVSAYTTDDVLDLKSAMLRKNNSTARQVSILSALKRFLEFCRKHEGLCVIDPNEIMVPKRPRREVAYLTAEEVSRGDTRSVHCFSTNATRN
jgi:site-specific recombinase XerD